MPGKRKVILVDFDGVLHTYDGNFGPPIGKPIPGARAAMHLLEKDYRVICFTSRNCEEDVRRWLAHYGFPPMKVTSKKESAHLIIDDRAITFDGTWSDDLIKRIRAFSPHWMKGEVEETDAPAPSAFQSPPENPQ